MNPNNRSGSQLLIWSSSQHQQRLPKLPLLNGNNNKIYPLKKLGRNLLQKKQLNLQLLLNNLSSKLHQSPSQQVSEFRSKES